MEHRFQETSCRKSSTLPSSRFHYIFANFESVIVSTNKQCVVRSTLAGQRQFVATASSLVLPQVCLRVLGTPGPTARVNYGTSFLFGRKSRAPSLRKPLDCWPSNFIARIRSRWDALRSYVRRPWRRSWISLRNTVFPHHGTALRTWKRNARLLTVSKRDRCSRLISACYSDQAWLPRLSQPNFPTCLYLQ
jgi:hypothetical protein